jgi:hypothetical protein
VRSWYLRAGIVPEARAKETSSVGSPYRAMASEDVTVDTGACVCVCVCNS